MLDNPEKTIPSHLSPLHQSALKLTLLRIDRQSSPCSTRNR
jgi:hypothetical protein